MTIKEKQEYTSIHLIQACEAFQEATRQTSNTGYQIDKIASGLLYLTMALENLDDRIAAVESALEVSSKDAD